MAPGCSPHYTERKTSLDTIDSAHLAATPPLAREWTQVLAGYRKPSNWRGILEIGITLVTHPLIRAAGGLDPGAPELRANSMLLLGKIHESNKRFDQAIDNYIKIATYYQGVPEVAAEGLWRGAQLLEKQASGELPRPTPPPKGSPAPKGSSAPKAEAKPAAEKKK